MEPWKNITLERHLLEMHKRPEWHGNSLEALHKKIQDKSFACPFAIQTPEITATVVKDPNDDNLPGYTTYKYEFIEDTTSPDSIQIAMDAIYNYLVYYNKLKASDPKAAARTALAIMVKPDPTITNIDQYGYLSFDFLRAMRNLDKSDWPTDVSNNPKSHKFSYGLFEKAMFVNINTPLHRLRNARNLGPGLVFIIQTNDALRFSFQEWDNEKNSSAAAKVNMVRSRIIKSDPKLPPSPLLSTHGEENSCESLQYLLADDNKRAFCFNWDPNAPMIVSIEDLAKHGYQINIPQRASGCPFHHGL